MHAKCAATYFLASIFPRWEHWASDIQKLSKPTFLSVQIMSQTSFPMWFQEFNLIVPFYDTLLCIYSLVKPGGVLIYSTCSVDPDENEERIAAFLLRHPVSTWRSYFYHAKRNNEPTFLCLQEFCVDSVEKYVSPPFVTEGGFYSSSPVKHSLDGAFAARLIRSTWLTSEWVCYIAAGSF